MSEAADRAGLASTAGPTPARPGPGGRRRLELTSGVWRATERELIIWRRTWRGNAVTLIVQPLLFLAAMGIGLGGLVDESSGDLSTRSATDISYLQFVTPGLLVASAMLAVAGSALWGFMAGIKWMGQYRSMVHTAMTPGDVFVGLVLFHGVKAGFGAALFVLVATVLGAIVSPWAILAVLVATVLASATVAGLGGYSATKENDFSFPLIMRLGVMPLFLLSGTFFPIEQLPDALRPLCWLSPLFHAAEAARMATTGQMTWWFLGHVTVLLALLAVTLPVGIARFHRRLTP